MRQAPGRQRNARPTIFHQESQPQRLTDSITMEKITAEEFKEKIDAGEEVFLLDVREPFEQYQSSIDYEHSQLIPLGQLSDRLDELEADRDREIVCLCRSGGRSEKACKLLEEEGFSDVKNLEGGINEWARKIDTSLPVY